MGCTEEEAAEAKAEQEEEAALKTKLSVKEEVEKAKSDRIDGYLEASEGFFSPNPGKVARGAKHAGEANNRLEKAERAYKQAEADQVKSAVAAEMARRAYRDCLAKEKNKKRPKKPKEPIVPPPIAARWKGHVTCIIEASAAEQQIHPGRTLTYLKRRVEQTWTINGEPQNPDEPEEYPAIWSYSISADAKETTTDWIATYISSGNGELESSLRITKLEGDQYSIQGPVRLETVEKAEKVTIHFSTGQENDEDLPLTMEPVELTARGVFVSVVDDPAFGEEWLIGKIEPVTIKSRGLPFEKWTRSYSWDFRR